jgi:hypothetical protein
MKQRDMRLFAIADSGKVECPPRPLAIMAEGYGHKPSDGTCHRYSGREALLA